MTICLVRVIATSLVVDLSKSFSGNLQVLRSQFLFVHPFDNDRLGRGLIGFHACKTILPNIAGEDQISVTH
jgi:hypothetical protein